MADQTLVQGAGLIAQSKGVGKLAAAGAWTKMSTDLSKKLAPVIQERHQTWEKYSNYRLAKEGLDDDDFDALYSDLEQKRREYIWGDKKARAKMMQNRWPQSKKVATTAKQTRRKEESKDLQLPRKLIEFQTSPLYHQI